MWLLNEQEPPWNHDLPPWISADKGMLIMEWRGRGRLVMLLAVTWWGWTPCQLINFALENTVHTSVMIKITFLQPPTTYPSICLTFFISSWRVHLDLQTLTCLFFSLAFSFVFSIYFYPYFFQGPRLSCWEPFLLYLNYLSAKIKQFGQTPFSILQL